MCFKDSEKDFTKNNLVNFWDEGKHVISQEWEDSSDLTSIMILLTELGRKLPIWPEVDFEEC